MNEREIFDAALRIVDPRARREFLCHACAGDVSLREQIEGLLKAEQGLGSFLVDPLPVFAQTIQMPGDSSSAESPGMMIGAYKLLEQIGEGGFGIVFMAEQQQPVRRKVALKVLKPGMDSRQVIARFEAERQALALMDHPNIARVFDAGATNSGRPYFVMELVRGIPITDFCDANQFTPKERLVLFVSVCQAVQHAHQKGIIHRDIKPSNVLVTKHDSAAVVKVIDFGVAKARGQQLTDKTLFTGFAQMIGTPLYMSPEQAELSGLDVDTRSDIYSLGVLLYELLTGTTPFDKERLKSAAFDEIRRIIREDDPPKPSTRLSDLSKSHFQRPHGQPSKHPEGASNKSSASSLVSIAALRKMEPHKLSQLVRGELDWIVMKALEKDRNRRYETASSFALDIQRYLADEPVAACPPSATYRLRKLARRNKAAFVAGTTVTAALLVAVLALAVSNLLVRRESAAKELALQEKSHALSDKVAALSEKDQALQRARTQETLAIENAATAEEQRKMAAQSAIDAKTQEKLARRRFYAAQMLLAQQAWENGQVGRVLELLEGERPRSDQDQDDLRSFEWYYLWRLCHEKHAMTLRGHRGAVHCARFSPDDQVLASSGRDGTVKVWDVRTGQVRFTLWGHRGNVNCVAFSPSGKGLASAGDDGIIRFWSVETGQLLTSIETGGLLKSIAFSPDGAQIASCGVGPTRLWDVEARREKLVFRGPEGVVVHCVTFSHDGKSLAVMYDNHTMRLWELSTGQERFMVSGGTWSSAVFSPDDSTVASGGWDRLVRLWDPFKGTERTTLKGHRDIVRSVAFAPDGKTLASAAHDRSVIVWDLTTGRQQLMGHMDAVRSVTFSQNGKLLASASEDGSIKLWDMGNLPESVTQISTKAEAGLEISPDNRYLATSSWYESAKIWEAATGRLRQILEGAHGGTLAFSPDNSKLASVGLDRIIRLWDVAAGLQLATFEGNRSRNIRSIVFSPDGTTLASASDDGTVILWDPSTRDRRATINAQRGWVTCIAYAPDGKSMATGSNDYMVKLWDTATHQERATGQHRNSIYTIAFSKDSATLASGSLDGNVKLWDTTTGLERLTINSHAGTISQVTCLPDGKAVAARMSDGTVKLWDMVTGQERATLKHTGQFLNAGMAFSHDGKLLATSGEDANVKLWRAATEDEVVAQSSVFDFREEPAFNLQYEGDLLLNNGRPREAERSFRRSLELYSKLLADFPAQVAYRRYVAMLHNRLGTALEAINHGPEAEQFYEQARQLTAELTAEFPTDPVYKADFNENLSTQVKLLRSSGRHLEALTVCDRAIEKSPNDSTAWKLRADCYIQLALWQEAVSDFEHAYRLMQPTDSLTFLQHALLRICVNDVSGYRKICEDMLARFGSSNDPNDCHILALAHAYTPQHLIEPSRMLAFAERAVAEGRISWRAAGLGLVLFRTGDFERARSVLEQSLQIDSNWNPCSVHSCLAMSYFRMHETDKAALALEKAQRARDDRLQAMLANSAGFWPAPWWDVIHGELLYREAFALIHGSQPPEDPRLLFLRGRALAAIDRIEPALSEFLSAVKCDPQNSRWVIEIRNLIMARDEAAQRQALIERVDRELPDVPGRADWDAMRGSWAAALAGMLKRIKSNPADHYCWYQSAPLYAKLGDIPGYRRHCNEMLSRFRDTDDPPIWERFSKACLTLPGTAQEIRLPRQLADRAVESAPQHEFLAFFELAQALAQYRSGEFTAALGTLERCLARENRMSSYGFAIGYLVRAMSHFQLGESEKSRRLFASASQYCDGLPQISKNQLLHWDWHDGIIVDLLKREAELLMTTNVDSNATPQSTRPAPNR